MCFYKGFPSGSLRDSLLCIFRQGLLKNKHLCNQELNGSDRLQERMSPPIRVEQAGGFPRTLSSSGKIGFDQHFSAIGRNHCVVEQKIFDLKADDLCQRLFFATWPSWECFFWKSEADDRHWSKNTGGADRSRFILIRENSRMRWYPWCHRPTKDYT